MSGLLHSGLSIEQGFRSINPSDAFPGDTASPHHVHARDGELGRHLLHVLHRILFPLLLQVLAFTHPKLCSSLLSNVYNLVPDELINSHLILLLPNSKTFTELSLISLRAPHKFQWVPI